MVEVVGHVPGGFCFLESGSRDVESSIGFYGALFSWDAERRPLAGGGSYTRFLKCGTPVAGMYEVTSEHHTAEIPSQWLTYVSVVDAVATLEHLQQGKVLPHCANLEQAQESFREAIEIADVLIPGRDNIVLNPMRQLM